MSDRGPDTVTIPRSDLIAVSRLLWEVGRQDSTSHQHKVDCFHWGARLDHLAGLPPHPGGPPTDEVIAFYERIRDHVEGVISGLQEWDQP